METKDLILRELTMDDFDNLLKIFSDEETMKYYPKPFDEEKTKKWILWNINNYEKYGFGLWGVVLKKTNTLIGDCGITMQEIDGIKLPEIGFHINKEYWNKGYATQGALACVNYAFSNTEFLELFCYQEENNIPSRRVAEKIGMKLRKSYTNDGITRSVYSVRKADIERK